MKITLQRDRLLFYPSNRTEDNNGNKDDSQDTGEGDNRGTIGRGGNGIDHIVHRSNQVHANYDTNHNTNESSNIQLIKPP